MQSALFVLKIQQFAIKTRKNSVSSLSQHLKHEFKLQLYPFQREFRLIFNLEILDSNFAIRENENSKHGQSRLNAILKFFISIIASMRKEK